MKRHYKKRTKVRSSWETYSDYYDKVAKRNPDMFDRKLTKKEFEMEFRRAKEHHLPNPAINIARSQRKWEYQFSRRYKAATGKTLTGRETKQERQEIFEKYVELYDGDYERAREEFEALY